MVDAMTQSDPVGHAKRSALATGNDDHGVRIRMYRLGVGDCFLVRFRRETEPPFTMLIDCGVHAAQAGGPDLIREVATDIAKQTHSRLDVLVVTHEHWDHVSGFKQAESIFAQFTVGEVWLAWTEDAKDEYVDELKKKKKKAMKALGLAAQALQMTGVDEGHPLVALQGFLGDTTGKNLAEVGKIVKKLANDGDTVRYWNPGEIFEIPGVNARAYVLGPPRDKDMIHRSDPRKGKDEVYTFGGYGMYVDDVEGAVCPEGLPPFDRSISIPMSSTRGIEFFQRHYWANEVAPPPPREEDVAREESRERAATMRRPRSDGTLESTEDTEALREDTTQRWRRIDSAWLDSATNLALKLDDDTNNTSLVLAFELGDVGKGPVLLFAADAQVGSWLTWAKVEFNNPFELDAPRMTGADLLERTVIYKVGHHASHNATLKPALESMKALELALVPTDASMAKKVKWGTLPWPSLLDRLSEITGKRVLRTDWDVKHVDGFDVTVDPLFYEVAY